MFPKVKVCSEIVDPNNMRFMHFRANDRFALEISKRERVNLFRLFFKVKNLNFFFFK
jgi:hypothetical protein